MAVVTSVGDVSRSVAVALLLVMILLRECKACGEAYLPLRVLFLQRPESKVEEFSKSSFKVIPQHCIAHPYSYCARFLRH